ncbi:MAG: hypothetical protein AAF840_01745 [Bacteroidota bacterium]
MINGPLYYAYFKHQAETHPDLLHVDEDNLVFAQVSLEEAIGDLRSANISASSYIMRLFRPSFRFSPAEMMPAKNWDGGFLIARKHDTRNQGSEDFSAAIDGCERIGEDIIEKMYADSANGHPLFQGRAHTNLTITGRELPVTGDGGYGGWLFLWSLPVQFTYCQPATRAAWTDGGTTPFAL